MRTSRPEFANRGLAHRRMARLVLAVVLGVALSVPQGAFAAEAATVPSPTGAKTVGSSPAESTTTVLAQPAPEAAGSVTGKVRYEQSDSRIAYTTGWHEASHPGMSGGTYRYTRALGAAIAVKFEGTSIAWIGPKFSSYGQAEVILDGVSQGMVSQYAPTLETQQVIWRASGLSEGIHTLEIRSLFARDTASAHYSVCVDAFEVSGSLLAAAAPARSVRVEEDDRRLGIAGPWYRAANTRMSDGVYAYTRSAGASFTIAFEGTSIAWIGPKFSSYGTAEVFLDGVSQGLVSQYAPSLQTRQVIWRASGLAPGEHTLAIVATGAKEAASASNSVCVDGFDIVGSARTAPRPAKFTRVEQTDSRLSWSGAWTHSANSAMSGGSYRFSKAAESEVTLTFRGTAVSWIGPKFSSYGQAAVYLDGRLVDVVSLYRPELATGRVVWSASGLADTTHEVRIRVLGTKQRESRYHSVCVDAFDVAGEVLQTYSRVEDDDPRLHFRTGSWQYASNAAMSGGSYRYTRSAGARVTIVFRGTGIAWIGPKSSSYGQAEVFIDSVSQGVVSQYAPSLATNRVIWQTSGLSDGVHTLTIVATGTKEAASASHSVCIDAVRVAGEVLNAPRPSAHYRIEQGDSRIVYLGSWSTGKHTGLSGGTHLYSRTRSSEIRVAFQGTEIAWIGTKAPSYGRADVYLDGRYVTTVSLYAPRLELQRVVWAATGLPNTAHEMRIVLTGTTDAASVGYNVSADAFETVGTFKQAERPKLKNPFNYPWSTYIVVDKSDFKLYYVKNGELVAAYPVAIGRSNAETPVAVWRIGNKYPNSGGVYGPRKIRLYRRTSSGSFIYTAYNIHGTDTPSSIGTKASAGCIRLYNHDILKLYPTVPLGTMVVTRE